MAENPLCRITLRGSGRIVVDLEGQTGVALLFCRRGDHFRRAKHHANRPHKFPPAAWRDGGNQRIVRRPIHIGKAAGENQFMGFTGTGNGAFALGHGKEIRTHEAAVFGKRVNIFDHEILVPHARRLDGDIARLAQRGQVAPHPCLITGTLFRADMARKPEFLRAGIALGQAQQIHISTKIATVDLCGTHKKTLQAAQHFLVRVEALLDRSGGAFGFVGKFFGYPAFDLVACGEAQGKRYQHAQRRHGNGPRMMQTAHWDCHHSRSQTVGRREFTR